MPLENASLLVDPRRGIACAEPIRIAHRDSDELAQYLSLAQPPRGTWPDARGNTENGFFCATQLLCRSHAYRSMRVQDVPEAGLYIAHRGQSLLLVDGYGCKQFSLWRSIKTCAAGRRKIRHEATKTPTLFVKVIIEEALEVARHLNIHGWRYGLMNFAYSIFTSREKASENIVLVSRNNQLVDGESHSLC